jgi:hypothetical protein
MAEKKHLDRIEVISALILANGSSKLACRFVRVSCAKFYRACREFGIEPLTYKKEGFNCLS